MKEIIWSVGISGNSLLKACTLGYAERHPRLTFEIMNVRGFTCALFTHEGVSKHPHSAIFAIFSTCKFGQSSRKYSKLCNIINIGISHYGI